jgi:hypothetical protein
VKRPKILTPSRVLWFWEWQPPEQMVTQTLQLPPLVERNETEMLEQRRAFGRRAGAAQRHAQAQLAEAVLAEIDRHPDVKPGELAGWLKRNPVTMPLVAHLKTTSLAKKISRRRQK